VPSSSNAVPSSAALLVFDLLRTFEGFRGGVEPHFRAAPQGEQLYVVKFDLRLEGPSTVRDAKTVGFRSYRLELGISPVTSTVCVNHPAPTCKRCTARPFIPSTRISEYRRP